MKMESNLKILLIVVFAVSMMACKSPSASNNAGSSSNTEVASMNEVKVPSNFNWRTYSDVEITIKSSDSGLMQITAPNGTVYYRANLNGTDAHTFKIPLPAFEKQLKATFNGVTATLDVHSGSISHQFN